MIPLGSFGPAETAVASFGHHLVTATFNLDLHPPGSPHVQADLDALVSSLRDARGAGVAMPLDLEIRAGRLLHRGQPLSASLQAGRLIRLCAERQIHSLAFDPGVDAAELLRFLVLLRTPQQKDAFEPHRIVAALGIAGVRHVLVGLAGPRDAGELEADAGGSLSGYQALARCVQESHTRACRGRQLDVGGVQGVVEQAERDLREGPSGLLSLASQDNVDRFTVGHSVRVALLALQVGRAVGVSSDALIRVGTAALLHDIGKSRVPQEILLKPGCLDADEWRAMAEHPRFGAEILLEQRDLDPAAVGTAFCHHLAPGGLGYPKPRFPFEPSEISKLVRVCDVFEALTSVRPYKRALAPIEAYTVMFRTETNFDPRWLRIFTRVLGLYPVGLRLRLDSGEEATVVDRGSAPHRPRVRIERGGEGGAPAIVTIGDAVDGIVREIDRVVTHDRSVPVGDQPAHVLTQHAHEACLQGIDSGEERMPR